MGSFIANNLLASFSTVLSATSTLCGIVFLFFDIKHKKKVSKKSAILIVAGILLAVGIVVFTHQSQQPTSDGQSLETPSSVVNTATDSAGVAVIEGDGNEVNITVNESTSLPDSSINVPLPVTVQYISLNYSTLALTVTEKHALSATVTYSDNSVGVSALWFSSNPAVADVDSNGTVIAKAAGTATITAQASKNNSTQTAHCEVTVTLPPTAPTGYSIRLSTDHAIMGETFCVYVSPYDEDITDIYIHAESPSGQLFDFPLSDTGEYLIDTEPGIWRISASVTNSAGSYTAQKGEDYVTIEITNIENYIENMLNSMI